MYPYSKEMVESIKRLEDSRAERMKQKMPRLTLRIKAIFLKISILIIKRELWRY